VASFIWVREKSVVVTKIGFMECCFPVLNSCQSTKEAIFELIASLQQPKKALFAAGVWSLWRSRNDQL